MASLTIFLNALQKISNKNGRVLAVNTKEGEKISIKTTVPEEIIEALGGIEKFASLPCKNMDRYVKNGEISHPIVRGFSQEKMNKDEILENIEFITIKCCERVSKENTAVLILFQKKYCIKSFRAYMPNDVEKESGEEWIAVGIGSSADAVQTIFGDYASVLLKSKNEEGISHLQALKNLLNNHDPNYELIAN